MKIKGTIQGSWSDSVGEDVWQKNKDIFQKQRIVAHSSIISAITNKAKRIESRMLEFGCGSGNYAIFLANLGYKILATDYEESSIELTQVRAEKYLSKKKANNINYMVLDACKMDIPDESFDLVYNIGAIEHLDIMKVLKECYRVLRKGGWMISAVPFLSLRWDLFWKLSCYMSKSNPYTQFLTKKEWREIYGKFFYNVQVIPSSFIFEAIAMRLFGSRMIYRYIIPHVLNTEIIVAGEKSNESADRLA